MHKIEIIKKRNRYVVEVTLANGYVNETNCDSEDQARVYARGLQEGFRLALNALGSGLFHEGTITEK